MTATIPNLASSGVGNEPSACINKHDDDGDGTSADDYTYKCTVCALEMSAGEVGDHVCYPD